MFKKQHLAKTAEEGKNNKVPKHTATRKLFKGVNEEAEWNSVCHTCKTKIKHSSELPCDDCQSLHHELGAYQNMTKDIFQF
jgi:rRNA maturation endonuclease Nob1